LRYRETETEGERVRERERERGTDRQIGRKQIERRECGGGKK
jgi:hypothetical protein